MSVSFSCAVCRALFCVPVCNTVLEHASECDLIWDSGLCWADCLTVSHIELFLWGKLKERHYCGLLGFLYLGAFISLNRLPRSFWPHLSHWLHLRDRFPQVARWPWSYLWTLLLGRETASYATSVFASPTSLLCRLWNLLMEMHRWSFKL